MTISDFVLGYNEERLYYGAVLVDGGFNIIAMRSNIQRPRKPSLHAVALSRCRM